MFIAPSKTPFNISPPLQRRLTWANLILSGLWTMCVLSVGLMVVLSSHLSAHPEAQSSLSNAATITLFVVAAAWAFAGWRFSRTVRRQAIDAIWCSTFEQVELATLQEAGRRGIDVYSYSWPLEECYIWTTYALTTQINTSREYLFVTYGRSITTPTNGQPYRGQLYRHDPQPALHIKAATWWRQSVLPFFRQPLTVSTTSPRSGRRR